LDFPKYLNFLLQFCPPVPAETELRAKFAEVGIEAGKPFDPSKVSEAQKAELALGVKEGYDSIRKQLDNVGKTIDGWAVGAAFGDREFYHGDSCYVRPLRSAASMGMMRWRPCTPWRRQTAQAPRWMAANITIR
jgi:hypothetical protein